MKELKGKKILITGGMGFIGSNLAYVAVSSGAKVTIYDCLDPKSGGNMKNIEGLEKKVKIIMKDIRSFEGISDAVVNQDIIFHCAAYTSHPESMKDPLIDIDVNCKGTIHVLEAMRRFSPKVKLVHVGTSTQIGKMPHQVIDELCAEFPMDIYSANKTVAEKYVCIYSNAYGLDTTVMRLVNIYGPRSNIRSSDFGFINYFVGLGLQNRELPIFGDGEQKRSVVYIDDAVSALITGAVHKKSKGEVFFISDDRSHTAKELAQEISTHIGGSIHHVSWPALRKAIEIGDAHISNKKISTLLGWKPTTTLSEGLIKTKEYFIPRLSSYI